MKIISTKIENNNLIINVDTASQVVKVYIDSFSNKKNMYSKQDADHEYVITDIISVGNVITIDVTDKYDSALIITIVGTVNDVALSIDYKSLYYAKVNALVQYCNTCLDKQQKERIVLCDFYSQLLQYSLDNSLTEDAIGHYQDIKRILNISDNTGYISSKSNASCPSCVNGVCSL